MEKPVQLEWSPWLPQVSLVEGQVQGGSHRAAFTQLLASRSEASPPPGYSKKSMYLVREIYNRKK